MTSIEPRREEAAGAWSPSTTRTRVSVERGETGGLSLLDQIREDLSVHGSCWKPGFQALVAHRVAVWRWSLPTALRKPVSLAYRFSQLLIRNVYGIDLPENVTVGRRVIIAHGGTLVVAGGTVIGDDCILRHNVTIGAVRRMEDVPTLGRRVSVGTGAVILGRINVGDFAEIAPNAVVLTNVPARATVFAEPGRVVISPRPAWDDAIAAQEAADR